MIPPNNKKAVELELTRRRFLRAGLQTGVALAAASVAPKAFAAFDITPYSGAATVGKKSLRFYNTHTLETVNTTFFDGGFSTDGLAAINHILRDHRTGDVTEMDTELLFLLHDVQAKLGTHEPFHIISGYRSPQSNALLRSQSNGVAKHSYHMQGMAIDVRLPGMDTYAIRTAAKEMERGGVGYYAESDFTHMDTGPVRSW